MKNTALCDLIATSENSFIRFILESKANLTENCQLKMLKTGAVLQKLLFVRSITSWEASYRLVCAPDGDVHHIR